MNVSHGEYEKMLKVYKKSVQQSAILTRLQEITSSLDHGLTNHLEDTFQFEPTGKGGFLTNFFNLVVLQCNNYTKTLVLFRSPITSTFVTNQIICMLETMSVYYCR